MRGGNIIKIQARQVEFLVLLNACFPVSEVFVFFSESRVFRSLGQQIGVNWVVAVLRSASFENTFIFLLLYHSNKPKHEGQLVHRTVYY